MLTKRAHLNHYRSEPAPASAAALERDGHVLLRGVIPPAFLARLRTDVDRVFDEFPPDDRVGSAEPPRRDMFRYELFNRSPVVQEALALDAVLEAVEPLLGEDCHVIANTAWRNPADPSVAPQGQEWHVDGGPHVIRPHDVPWPDAIPYPVFVVTAHLYLQRVQRQDGPTAILPGSHRSGCLPPFERRWEPELEYEGCGAAVHLAEAGDVSLFVSDTWHRRMPQGPGTRGRYFVQCIYARREIAPRLTRPELSCHASQEARERARTPRERQLIGLHEACFYDG
ncbi:MAG: phytanoyl-CoA dioxygenase family protein [Planctomycetota bacterium]|jgi:hypothetical protein